MDVFDGLRDGAAGIHKQHQMGLLQRRLVKCARPFNEITEAGVSLLILLGEGMPPPEADIQIRDVHHQLLDRLCLIFIMFAQDPKMLFAEELLEVAGTQKPVFWS